MTRLTIAVDGPASSGKGTLARGIAKALGYQYVDTGAMYRSVALRARQAGITFDDEESLSLLASALRFSFAFDGDRLTVHLDDEDVTDALRAEWAGVGASAVSKLPGVRQALLGLQRDLGARGGVVMDGRDIGTVVLPDADLKIYLEADVHERARRRHLELQERGEQTTYEQVLSDLRARDAQDMNRATAPLRAADDAVILDSTVMTPTECLAEAMYLVDQKGRDAS